MAAGDGFDVIIDGRGYMVDYTEYRRRTIPSQKEQRDTSTDVGEQTLSIAGQWVRSQTDWVHGAGQEHYDFPDSDRSRFSSSKNVDVFTTKGEISITREPEQKITTTNSNLYARLVNGSVFYFSDGDSLKFGNPDVASYSPSEIDMDYAILDWTSDGTSVYAAQGANGVRKATVSATTGDTTVGSFQADVIEFANGRLLAADAARIVELSAAGAVLTFDKTLVGTCAGIKGGPQSIYAAFNQNGQGVLYTIGVSATDGSLAHPVPAAVLPLGETFNGPFGMDTFGSVIGVATSAGFRLGAISPNDNQSVTFGPAIDAGGAAYSVRIVNRFVYWGTKNGDTYKGDLSAFTKTLTPAYSRFVAWDSDTKGNVQSIELSGGKVFFTDSLGELYGESYAGTKAASANVVVGSVSYGTTASKVIRSASARFSKEQMAPGTGDIDYRNTGYDYAASGTNYRGVEPVSPGYIQVQVVDDENIQTDMVLSATTAEAAFLPTNEDVSNEAVTVTLVLNRDSGDATTGPVVQRWSLNARPQPGRIEEIVAPLVLHGRVSTSYGAGAPSGYDSKDEYLALRSMAMTAETVVFQEGERTENVTVEDLELAPIRYSDDGSWWEGTCLVRMVTVP
ncbi:MAG: hypothetical protein MKZ66_05860 [Acidimicrobiales bacterium]|nr:hypothetical protein [Acidimicrobiales bacterium]